MESVRKSNLSAFMERQRQVGTEFIGGGLRATISSSFALYYRYLECRLASTKSIGDALRAKVRGSAPLTGAKDADVTSMPASRRRSMGSLASCLDFLHDRWLKADGTKGSRSLSVASTKRVFRLRAALAQIIKPAFPTLISIWCASIVGISDACIAGKIGTDSLAAMAFCEQFWFLLSLVTTALAAAVSMGMAQCRASAPAAKRQRQFLANSLCAAALSGLAILIASLASAFIFHQHHGWFNGNAELVAQYFHICAFSMLPFAILQVQCAALRALDRHKQFMRLWIFATLAEIILANIFVNCGWRSLAALAGAWTVACLGASAQGFVYLRQAMPNLSWRDFTQTSCRQKIEDLVEILQLGIPVALSESGILASSYLNLQIISSLPAAQTLEAAWAIRTRLEEFAEFAPTCAIGISVSTFAAKYDARCKQPGGKNSRRNRATISVLLSAVALTVAVALCFSLLTLLIGSALVHNFTQDLVVEDIAALVLSISSLAWPLFAVSQLLFSSLAANGKGHVASVATLVCLLPLRLGLAMLLKDQACLPAIAGVTISGVIAQGALAALTAILFFNSLSPIFYRRKSAIFWKPGT